MGSLLLFQFLSLGVLITGVSVSLMVAFFPLYSKKYTDANEIFIGLVFAMNPIGGVISSLLVGKWLKKINRLRTFMSVGLMILSVGFLILTFMDNISSKGEFEAISFIGRFITGFGARTFETPFFASIPIYFSDSINTKMTIAQITSSLGYVCGPLLGSFLYDVGGLKLPFITLTIFTFIMSILILLFDLEELNKQSQTLQDEEKQNESDEINETTEIKIGYTQLISVYQILSNLLMLFSMCIMYTYYHPTIAQYFQEQFNIDSISIGYFVSLKSFFFGITSFILSFFTFNKINSITLCMFVMSFTQFFMGPDPLTQIEPKIYITITAQFIIGSFSSCPFIYALPIMVDYIQAKYPKKIQQQQNIALISGLLNASESLGNILGPIVAGVIAEHYQFQRSSSFLGIFLFIVSLIYLPNSLKNYGSNINQQ